LPARCPAALSPSSRSGSHGVEVISEYRLRLTFPDGTVGDVDFNGREWRGVFEPLNDPVEFARVEVDPEAGTIT